MQHKIGFIEALKSLQQSEQVFKTMLEHGTLAVELYKPDKVDKQSPHEQDEVYIIASGSGKFMLEDQITTIKTGDFLFVPARAAHRFIEFTDDFSTWVLFYGPAGGENGTIQNYLS